MPNKEIVSLAPQDVRRIAHTIFRLRQMRGSHFFEDRQAPTYIPSVCLMLNDAEELGIVAADALVGLVQTGSPVPLVARWEEALNDFGLKYRRSFDYGVREIDAATEIISIIIKSGSLYRWQSPVRRLLQDNDLSTL